MLARIRTDSPSEVSHIAEALRRRGYQVEIVSSHAETTMAADVEIAAESFPAQEALAQARELADRFGCDLLIAPGALEWIRTVQAEAGNQPVALAGQLAPVANIVAPQEIGPDWTRRALEQCAVALAKLRGVMEGLPGIAARINSRGWSSSRRGGTWLAGKAKTGGARLGVAYHDAAVSTAERWAHAREQYTQVRAVATAKAEQMRAERQLRAAAKNRVAVEVLETTAPSPQTSARGWRAALAGAVMAALVIGVGFSVGAGRTPAATRDLTSVATKAPAVTAKKTTVPPASAITPKPRAAKISSTALKPKPKHAAVPDDSEQEVIVRHFAPVKSTPAVSADGVHHYSDTDHK